MKKSVAMTGISDHVAIYATFDTERIEQKRNPIKFRSYISYDDLKLREDTKKYISPYKIQNNITAGNLD